MLYKIVIEDRNYTKWQLYEAPTLTAATISGFDPAANHLFSNDVFEYTPANGLVNGLSTPDEFSSTELI